jgi:hypothetical protein
MIEIHTGDRNARSFVFFEGREPLPTDCIIEYWGPVALRNETLPAEVNYFAGGPSSSTMVIYDKPF